jgi:hypothetical protein
MRRIDSVRTVAAIVVLSVLPPVYAADKFPDYPVRQAGDYAVSTQKNGLTIGVQPVEDLKDQKTFFHTELTPKGFIPVFIVMQNGSSGDSFLFDKTKVTYGPGVSIASSPNPDSKAGEGIAIVSPLVGFKMMANASHVQQNILEKGVQSKTLSPGASVRGFLYVPVPKDAPRQKIHLQVPVSRAGTGETFVMDLVF